MTTYVFLPQAEEEMLEAAAFYESKLPGLGSAFLAEVQRLIEVVLDQPQIGQEIAPPLRRVLLRRFPFLLIYAPHADEIVIVAVAHQRRRPAYWKKRIDR